MNKVQYKKVSSITKFIDAIRIRVDVFIKEQGFAVGWEPDEDDKTAIHYIAIDNGMIVATARVREMEKNEFKIERMATKKEYRGQGIGTGLINYIIGELQTRKAKRIWMQAQCQAQDFYEKCGFKPISKPFNHHGLDHIEMEYPLKNS